MNELPALPLVSVVMCTYNGGQFLAKQLDAVLQQTHPAIEIIVVDDGSTDHTRTILQQYASQHARLKVYLNEANLGYIRNFEKACGLATGSYIALCDQDDYWVPEKIEKLLSAIGNYPMVYSDSLLCNEQLEPIGKKISDAVVCQPFHSCLQQAVFCRVYGHATLIKSSLIKQAVPFPAVLPHDWWLSFTATLHGGITYFNEPLVWYRQHSNNVFGAVGGKRKKEPGTIRRQKKQQELLDIRARMHIFYEACPDVLQKEKKVLLALADSYRSFSLINNLRRVALFLRYSELFLAVKKRSAARKLMFCLKMFVKIK